jgi:superfamily II DNA or RNA helicase
MVQTRGSHIVAVSTRYRLERLLGIKFGCMGVVDVANEGSHIVAVSTRCRLERLLGIKFGCMGVVDGANERESYSGRIREFLRGRIWSKYKMALLLKLPNNDRTKAALAEVKKKAVVASAKQPNIVVDMYLEQEKESEILVSLPFALGYALGKELRIDMTERLYNEPAPGQRAPSTFSNFVPPHRKPLAHQVDLLARATKILEETRCVMFVCSPSAGKTYMSLLLALRSDLKIVIITESSKLPMQWADSLIKIRCPPMPNSTSPEYERELLIYKAAVEEEKRHIYIEALDPAQAKRSNCRSVDLGYAENIDDPAVDVFIFRFGRLAVEGREKMNFLKGSFLIMDETHKLCSPSQVEQILKCRPSYVIGCSATPTRDDKLHRVTFAICGKNSVSYLVDKPFTFVIMDLKVTTSDKTYESLSIVREKGRKLEAYGDMEATLSYSEITLDRIAALAEFEVRQKGAKILIITKFVKQAQDLETNLVRRGITTSIFVANSSTFDGNASVLIGTTQKVGVGFDQESFGIAFDKRFNVAILCQSVAQEEALTQYIGRILRSPDEMPRFIWLRFDGIRVYNKHVDKAIITVAKLETKRTMPNGEVVIVRNPVVQTTICKYLGLPEKSTGPDQPPTYEQVELETLKPGWRKELAITVDEQKLDDVDLGIEESESAASSRSSTPPRRSMPSTPSSVGSRSPTRPNRNQSPTRLATISRTYR